MSKAMGFWRRRWKWGAGGGLVLLAALLLAQVRFANTEPRIPTAEVTRGPFQTSLNLRGEVKAQRSVQLTAPREAGRLMIVKLAPDGELVKKGAVVVQFESSMLAQHLAEDKSALATAAAQVQQSEAQAKLTDQADVTAVMTDRYTLQSAQLDASKRAILSKIDGEEAELKVADAQLALKQAEKQLKMDRAAAAADLADQKEKRDKAAFDVERDETALAHMSLIAPSDGVVTILSHWTPNGPMHYRLGDQVWSGAVIAELPDLSTIYFDARSDETDRSQLRVGQGALVHADALPGQRIPARVRQISTLASTDFSAPWPFPRNFEVEITFDGKVSKLRPGMSAAARVTVGQIPDALQVPARAVFQQEGQTVAYVLEGSVFRPRRIQVGTRGDGNVVVTGGLRDGERVALQKPGTEQ